MSLTPGTRIGPYEVQELIGSGGMGHVFKAHDTRLGRTVALKILRTDRPVDEERRRRFMQEARAASTLNHPHIVALYDILSENGSDVLVMEYVPGKTLDQVIPKKGLRLQDTLRYGIQIADALAAAHHSGIVHRDLKPSNILTTETGSVKLLDLGLAKLFEPHRPGEEDVTRTLEKPPLTVDGAIVGTASYMSPEQAEGKPVDARSDIFSFGCVLYEMVTGLRAFQGTTRVSTISAILRDEPRPVGQVSDNVPRDLEKIITRCLRKDLARRYQTLVDVKNTLEELKEESDTGRLNEKQAPPQTVSNRIRWWAYLSVIAVAAVAGAGAWFVHSKSGRAEGAPRPIPLTTDPGWEVSPSLSPDGNQVAFTWFRAESNTPNSQIYVKLIGAGEPLRLTNGLFDSAPSWSPDGRWIAFQRYQPPDTFELRIITVLGGAERKLVSLDGATTFSWSADSKWIACGSQRNPKGLTEIALISTESAEKQVLLAARSALEDVGYPAFAPDGKKLGFVRGSRATGSDLFVLPLTPELKAGGEPIQLTHDGENKMGLAWTADSADVVFAAGAYDQTLWRVNSSGRSERHLLGVGPGASQPSISARGQKLAYAQGSFDVNIWRIGKTGKGAVLDPSRFISSTRFEHSAQYSPDGRRIAFTSNRSGSFEIWVTDSAGTRPVQITAFGRNESGSPRWSPDGKSIAFDSNAEGQLFQIYTINADGGKPLRLTDGAFENAMPCWSQDGKWIYFESSRTGRSEIWKVSANGGEPHQITTNGGYTAVESADGKWLYFTATGDVPTSLKVMPVEGGPEREVLKSVNPRNFAVTKRGIYYQAYMPSDPDQLASFDFGTKQSRTILVFKSGSYAGLSSSPDERYILYAAYDQIASDLRLLENFQ